MGARARPEPGSGLNVDCDRHFVVKAAAHIVAERRGDITEIVGRRAEAPWAVRRCGERVLLAATAAAPVGGDDLSLRIDVGPGATLRVGSVAATLAWPGPDGRRSSTRTECRVGAGARLELAPEPTVAVAGCRHRVQTVVQLAAQASCLLVDELVLGRTGEAAGDIDYELRVEREGRPLLHHGEQFGPMAIGAASSVSVGAGRFVVSALVVGEPAGRSRVETRRSGAAAWLPLDDDAGLLLAVGPDRATTWSLIRSLVIVDETDYGKTIRPTPVDSDTARPTTRAGAHDVAPAKETRC